MSGPDDRIVNHYSQGGLFDRILAGLAAQGVSPDNLRPEDLKPVDEFHIGGIEATRHLIDQLEIPKRATVLDIGCGIGGTARFLAANYGVHVTGLDLTPEFVETARRLTRLVGLEAEFTLGSALDMPFAADAFDVATLIHVGMNLPDKRALFAEAARVLRPGATFAIYDVMQLGDDAPAFPLPWASTPEASFLATPAAYVEAAAAAGFAIVGQTERGAFARDFFAKLSASLAGSAPPPVGLNLLMGANTRDKIGNMVAAVGSGLVAPVELICQAPA